MTHHNEKTQAKKQNRKVRVAEKKAKDPEFRAYSAASHKALREALIALKTAKKTTVTRSRKQTVKIKGRNAGKVHVKYRARLITLSAICGNQPPVTPSEFNDFAKKIALRCYHELGDTIPRNAGQFIPLDPTTKWIEILDKNGNAIFKAQVEVTPSVKRT